MQKKRNFIFKNVIYKIIAKLQATPSKRRNHKSIPKWIVKISQKLMIIFDEYFFFVIKNL